MPTIVHWIHMMAVVFCGGGLAFLLLVVMPSLGTLNPEEQEMFAVSVMDRFRWVIWAAIFLLFVTGLYGIRQFYWEVAWGWSWMLLTLKIILSLLLFLILLALTLRLKALEWIHARQQTWLTVALSLTVTIILIAAYLRRG